MTDHTSKVVYELGQEPERPFCPEGLALRLRYLRAGPMINSAVFSGGDGGQIALAKRMVDELTHGDLPYRSKRLAYLSHVRECPRCRLAVGSGISSKELRKLLESGNTGDVEL